jgi:hypothetical protein
MRPVLSKTVFCICFHGSYLCLIGGQSSSYASSFLPFSKFDFWVRVANNKNIFVYPFTLTLHLLEKK